MTRVWECWRPTRCEQIENATEHHDNYAFYTMKTLRSKLRSKIRLLFVMRHVQNVQFFECKTYRPTRVNVRIICKSGI